MEYIGITFLFRNSRFVYEVNWIATEKDTTHAVSIYKFPSNDKTHNPSKTELLAAGIIIPKKIEPSKIISAELVKEYI